MRVVNSESLKDFGYGVICFLVILAIPFSVGLGLLLVVGVAWWIAVPIALVTTRFVRSLLFGPPCGSGHRHRRSILGHVLTALVVGLGSFGLWQAIASM